MRIAVAMSGGVDSSVAALLLAREGAEVVGVSMHLWDHDREGGGAGEGRCCTLDDLRTARRAAEAVGVPHYTLDLRERFLEAVVRPFVASYLEGETPVPCLTCNTEVKFDALFRRARALGCEAVATGHYARTRWGSAGGWGWPRASRSTSSGSAPGSGGSSSEGARSSSREWSRCGT